MEPLICNKKIEKEKLFFDMARDIKSPKEIAEQLCCTEGNVYKKMKATGIYSKRTIVNLLSKKSDEQIASEGNVNIEAVSRIRKQEDDKIQIELEKHGKQERRLKKTEIFLKMAKDGIEPTKIADEFYDSAIGIYHNYKRYKIYSRKRIIDLLPIKSDEEIAMEGNVNIEAVIRIRKEQEEKEQQFFKMAQDVESPNKIAKQLGCSENFIYKKMRVAGIYSKRTIVNLLSKKSDEQISREGNVNIEAVTRIREEIQKNKELKKMARDVQKPKEIAEKLSFTEPYVYNEIRMAGIYTRKTIVRLLSEKTDQQIAKEGNVNITAVARIRREEKEKNQFQKERKKISKDILLIEMGKKFESTKNIKKKLEKKEFYLSESQILNFLKNNGIYTREQVIHLIRSTEKTDKEIAEESGGSITIITEIREGINTAKILLRLSALSTEYISYKTGLTSQEVKKIKEEIEKNKIHNTPIEKRKVDLKIKMIELRAINKRLVLNSEKGKQTINYKIDTILQQFGDVLTNEDYALLIYTYIKIGEYVKAIEFSEEKLGLINFTIKDIVEKIKELLNIQEEKEISIDRE